MLDIFNTYLDYMFYFNIFHLISIICCIFTIFNRKLYYSGLEGITHKWLYRMVLFVCLLTFSFPPYIVYFLCSIFITMLCTYNYTISYESYDIEKSKFTIVINNRIWFPHAFKFTAACIYLPALYLHVCITKLVDSYSSYLDFNIVHHLFFACVFSIVIIPIILLLKNKEDDE